MRSIRKIAAVFGVTSAVIGLMATAAVADPPSGVRPGHLDTVGVGSDTTQNVLNAIASDYNAFGYKHNLYSYNAVGNPANINAKGGCSAITRPNGSGAGIAALKANARPSGDSSDYCIDFARSSRAPQASDGPGLAFVRFAQDAVTWSATTSSSKPTNAPTSLSNTELRAIYECNAAILGGGKRGPVTWNEVGGTGTDAVVPVIPQSASGTRAFFLAAIGITGTAPAVLGSCVKGTDNSVEENEGTNAIFSGSNSDNIVFPYSVAVYLAQSQNGHDAGAQGNQVLRSAMSGTKAIAPTVGSAGNLTLNPQLATVGLTRFVYNVVRDDGSSTHVPAYLQKIFGNGSGHAYGYVCTSTASKADITSFGFRLLGQACGTVTTSS